MLLLHYHAGILAIPLIKMRIGYNDIKFNQNEMSV